MRGRKLAKCGADNHRSIKDKKRIPEWGDGNSPHTKAERPAIIYKKRIPEWGDGNMSQRPYITKPAE